MSEGKKTRGRQRIEIKELAEESKKQVTFSKRRAGLFKKAGELCVLCGAEVAIIVFSPHNNVFCFGHPDVETVLDRYLTGNHSSFSRTSSSDLLDQNLNNVNNVGAAELMNIQYAEAQEELEREKKRLVEIEEEVKRKKMENNGEYLWWEEAVLENMELEEMEHYMSALQEMRWKVGSRLEQFRMMRSATHDACAWDSWGTMLL
ncbi:agamous-like MADS-box protein AGL61 isoform X2 [Juglans microcarpa x Juglans regia]|nr:agamous-like MADS-box protein AGL61 isoform X2 [Juglans microcarpa x Juglans regia]